MQDLRWLLFPADLKGVAEAYVQLPKWLKGDSTGQRAAQMLYCHIYLLPFFIVKFWFDFENDTDMNSPSPTQNQRKCKKKFRFKMRSNINLKGLPWTCILQRNVVSSLICLGDALLSFSEGTSDWNENIQVHFHIWVRWLFHLKSWNWSLSLLCYLNWLNCTSISQKMIFFIWWTSPSSAWGLWTCCFLVHWSSKISLPAKKKTL